MRAPVRPISSELLYPIGGNRSLRVLALFVPDFTGQFNWTVIMIMGCHSRWWMILIDIIWFSNDLRGVHQQGTRIGWPRLDSSFVYRAKQPGLGGGKDGDFGEWISSSQLPFCCWKSRAWLTEQQEETDAQIAAVRQRMKASNLWPTCFGYLDAQFDGVQLDCLEM